MSLRRAYTFFATFVTGLLLFVMSAESSSAVQRDALPPDTGVLTSPLNTGLNTQQKTGSLIIGANSGTSVLCLNAASSADTSGNCISDWSQISVTKYIAIYPDALDNFSTTGPYATFPANYTLQKGYSDVTAKSSSQNVTAAIISSDVTFCVRDYTDQDTGYCSGQAKACNSNSDCADGPNENFVGTAVYGTSNGSTTSYAGYFGGTVYVHAPTTSLFSSNDRGRICLGSFEPPYAQVSGGADGCISSWNELTTSVAPYVQLQSANPPVSQTYGAAISGSSVFGSAVIGSTAGLSVQMTCSNGICDANESTSSCSIDCSGVSSLTSFAPNVSTSATLANLKIDLPFTVATQQPTAVKVLIVRSLNTAPTFRPVNGVDYTVGTNLGNNTVVAINTTTTSGATVSNLFDTLPARGTYYYQAYQANTYPKYSSPSTAVAITPMQLTTSVSPINKATITSSPSGIACSNTTTNCVKLFNSGTVVNINLGSITAGYQFNRWTGTCDQSSNSQCTVTMNSDKVNGVIVSTAGGGGGGGGKTD